MKRSHTTQNLDETPDVKYWSSSISTQAITTLIMSLVVSACGSTPGYRPSQSYESSPIFTPPIVTTPSRPELTNKFFSHNGPLWDRICTYTFSTNEKVLKLCDFKPPKITQRYTKDIPGITTWVPWTSTYTPPKSVYGYNPKTFKYENYIEPGKTLTTPGKNTYTPPTTEYCTKSIPYSQTDGSPLSEKTECR